VTSATAERLLSMSVFEAALVIRTFKEKNIGLSDDEVVLTVRSVRADLYPLDYEAGLVLETALPPNIDTSPRPFFRSCVDRIVALKSPIWVRLAPGGREQVTRALGLNVAQCLRAAGLLDNPPDRDTWLWWDRLASAVRADRDAALLAQGREAELWSYERECKLVADAGIERAPMWVSIEDNSLGYDILSYRREGEHEVNRLIEVKSTQSNPPRLILTRNEWNTVAQYGDALEFHLWTLQPKELYVLSAGEMQQHIPENRGSGMWLQVEVTFNASKLVSEAPMRTDSEATPT
jgi:hypothetical protein